MRIKLDQNGWTVHIEDFDFNDATRDDIDIIGCLASYYTLVVFRNQKLEIQTEERLARMFGTTQDEQYGEEFLEKDKEGNHPLYEPDGTITFRVTGEKNDNGVIGLFGFDEELAWHCNKIDQKERRGLVWLYGVHGTKSSETQFTNHVLAYNDLSDKVKKRIQDLEIIYDTDPANSSRDNFFKAAFTKSEYKGPTFGLAKVDDGNFNQTYIPTQYTPRLVHTNDCGQVGLSIFPTKVEQFKGMSVAESQLIVKSLDKHIMGNMNYRYCHHWEDGDILLSEQWLGLHRRLSFAGMSTRKLHRIESDFDKIDFSKLNSALYMVENTN